MLVLMLVVMIMLVIVVMMFVPMIMMMVVPMPMRMPVAVIIVMMMFILQMNIELQSLNRGLLPALPMQVITANLQLAKLRLELPRLNAQIQARANEHVAADARKNIQIKCVHSFSESRLICVAAKAAPNPLSIFTTVTPDPQLFNIPNSAASPPKLAP